MICKLSVAEYEQGARESVSAINNYTQYYSRISLSEAEIIKYGDAVSRHLDISSGTNGLSMPNFLLITKHITCKQLQATLSLSACHSS